MTLRVAHVITRMIVGGAQETVLLATALADRSAFAPVVLCGPETGPEGSLHGELRRRGVEVVLVPSLVRRVHPVHDARALLALERALRDLRCDVVHTNSSKAGILGRVAARRAGVRRVVHTVHGWPFHDQQRRAVSEVWKRLERSAAPLCDRLVVVAEADRKKGLAAGVGSPEQYALVRSGLELSLYGQDAAARAQVRVELGLPLDALVVGAVNRLSPQKDPLTLVRALREVVRCRPAVRVLVVGDGPLRAEVEREAADLLGSGALVLTGLRNDVPRLLQAMDVFVSASRWEGLPRTVLQAMASGLPVVATAADGILDVVEDQRTGVLVPIGDVTSLALAVEALLARPDRGRSLVERARQRLPEFGAERMVRQLEDLYLGQ